MLVIQHHGTFDHEEVERQLAEDQLKKVTERKRLDRYLRALRSAGNSPASHSNSPCQLSKSTLSASPSSSSNSASTYPPHTSSSSALRAHAASAHHHHQQRQQQHEQQQQQQAAESPSWWGEAQVWQCAPPQSPAHTDSPVGRWGDSAYGGAS
ncbi:hypothetical protein DIPPA_27435 [Diplonema papillatum]|nr:hypothetical protein DIPPA_27435 [Diplonema papillatum]